MNDKNERSKKKGLQPMKGYPIKQVLESIPDPIGKTPNSLPIFNSSRQSPSPSPLQRTKSNESYSSKTSPSSSRGVSPVASYLQSQWPRDIRQSLLKNDIECQTESSENSEVENCENCLPSNQVKSLTSEGTVLKEMKRIKNMTSVLDKNIGTVQPDPSVKYPASVKAQYQIHRRSRPPSTESYNDEIIGYSDMENDSRFLSTPADGRRAPRPASNDSQTQTDHFCPDFKPVNYPSPCQSPGKTNRHHPPSPRTNHSFLFKREPPDGAEVVPLLNDSNSKDDFRDIISTAFFETSILPHIEMKDSPVMIENQSTNMVKHENTFTPSPNSMFKQIVRYKPSRSKENNDADQF
jgi:hypothetical protein